MSDKIIKGNFGPKAQPTAGNPNPGDPRQPTPPTYQGIDHGVPGGDETARTIVGPDGKMLMLTEDQHKAIGLILSGMAFVFIGIKPTGGGADFYTATNGDPGDLRNAQDELPGAIARLFHRKGITT
ncbi:MAG: hypothetical protein WC869_01140 [Phycisphaerae bacterium]|jgi:hypothetical protein